MAMASSTGVPGGRFSEAVIEEIRGRTNLATLAEEAGVKLKTLGVRYWGKCPFHWENTASFSIRGDLYHCFGCVAGGDAFKFIQDIRGITFPEAVKYLAHRAGIELEELTPRERQRAAREAQAARVAGADALAWKAAALALIDEALEAAADLKRGPLRQLRDAICESDRRLLTEFLAHRKLHPRECRAMIWAGLRARDRAEAWLRGFIAEGCGASETETP